MASEPVALSALKRLIRTRTLRVTMVTRDEVGKPTNVLIVSGGLGCGTLTGAAVVTLSSAPLTRPRAGG